MAVYTISTQDIVNNVLKKCGELTDGTSTYDTNGTVLDYVNRAYLDVLSGGNEFLPEFALPWPWALDTNPVILTLKPPIQAGSISVTANSTSLTFSSAPVDENGNNISVLGWWIQVQGRPEWFKISAHTSGQTSATLDVAYTDSTGTSLSYLCAKLEYTISTTNGVLRMVEPLVVYRPQNMQGDQEAKIYFCDEATMLRDYPLTRIIQETPTRFSIVSKDSGGIVTVRFNSYVQYATRVEVRLISIPTALTKSPTEFCLIPVQKRKILEYCASHWLCLDKNDNRADVYKKLAVDTYNAMKAEALREKTNTGKSRGQLIPRQDLYWQVRRYVVQEVT